MAAGPNPPAPWRDPFARASLARSPSATVTRAGGALCWVGENPEARLPHLCGIGPPGALAALVAAAASSLPATASLPLDCRPVLAGHQLMLAQSTEWDFRWTDAPPAPQPGEQAVAVLPAGRATDTEVGALLAAASPTASALPGEPAVLRWVGVRDPSGQLVAAAADTSRGAGVGHLSSVATLPQRRGQGLAGAVTAALTRLLLADGNDVVTLGLYASNDAARRLYARLGFAGERRMISGTLQRALPTADRAPAQPEGGAGTASMPASAR